MKTLLSIGLGFVIALTILNFVPKPKVSNYGFGPGDIRLNPAPLEMDDSNLALIGVGLATPTVKPSVMDASPASSAKPVMIAASPMPPMPAQSPMPPMPAQSPMPPMPAQSPMPPMPSQSPVPSLSMSPVTIKSSPSA